MKKTKIALGVLALIVLASCKKEIATTIQDQPTVRATSENSVAQIASSQNSVPNELLVKFKSGTSQSGRENAFARISANVQEHIVTAAMKHNGDNEGFYLIHTPLAVEQAVGKMKGLSEIEYAEPNWIYSYGATTVNDSYFTGGQLWGMYSSTSINGDPVNQYGSQANTAWANGHTGSSTVYVGVVDEGAMYNHQDLQGNFGNPKEIAGNGIDDDGNGYIDDAYGWDFVNNDNTTFDGTGDDHGTHVSGTIGAIGNNKLGVAGVCWHVKIISAKFLGTNGGTTANAIKAIDYITNLKIHDGLNIVATNNSWGGGGFSQSLQDAIERANQANILFIAAAGNGGSDGVGDNNDAVANYPSNYPNSNVIAVAAITSSGGLASFSNYGATTVDIGAPGYGIYSTLPGGHGKTISSTYGSYSGTSMATPHVTGAAALYASTHPNAAAAEIKNAILTSATPTASLQGKCVSGGRLNVSSF